MKEAYTYVYNYTQAFSKLAQQEILSVQLNTIITQVEYLKDGYLKVQSQKKHQNLDKLACTKKVARVLFEGSIQTFFQTTFELHDKSYKIDFTHNQNPSTLSEKDIRKIYTHIYSSQKKPKIVMKEPQSTYIIYCAKEKVLFTKLIHINTNTFMTEKKNQMYSHSFSTNPQIARAMINLTELQKGIILDPFCGFAGILYQAIKMGFTVIGSDISRENIKVARDNFIQQRTNIPPHANYSFQITDATTITQKVNAIVCDLPYGINTKNISPNLYKNFILHVQKQKLTNKIVLCTNQPESITNVCQNSSFSINFQTTIPVHKTLTRHIFVIQIM